MDILFIMFQYGLCYTMDAKQDMSWNIEKFRSATISIEFKPPLLTSANPTPTDEMIAFLHDSEASY